MKEDPTNNTLIQSINQVMNQTRDDEGGEKMRRKKLHDMRNQNNQS